MCVGWLGLWFGARPGRGGGGCAVVGEGGVGALGLGLGCGWWSLLIRKKSGGINLSCQILKSDG